MNIYELHEKMTKHLFPAYSSEDERFLSLALCGEVAELVEVWGRGNLDIAEARDELADCRVYLELLAKCFDIEGDKLVFDAENAAMVASHLSNRLLINLCISAGLLANLIKKRWRDDVDLTHECQDAIVTTRFAIECVAHDINIPGDKLDAQVENKLKRVAEKHAARIGGAA